VRREGRKLGLHGRSPMEEIQLPPFVPKQERHLYRDAVIASHAGKTLAGLFYLRSFIERFARRVIGECGKRTRDEIMQDYGKALPAAQRDSIPSLREWYGRLSDPIRAAKDDGEVFNEAKEAIDLHFDIRRVYKMPEVVSMPAPPPDSLP
jgi:hypothetical protein